MSKQNAGEQPYDDNPDESPQIRIPEDVLREVSGKFGERIARQFAELYGPKIQGAAAQILKQQAAALSPQTEVINGLLPQIRLQMPAIDTAMRKMTESITAPVTESLKRSLDGIFKQQREQWESYFANFRKLAETWFPSNWAGVDFPSPETLETILLDEGIPLAWVPSQEMLQALLSAPDEDARRTIIEENWERITSDCEAVLNGISSEDLQPYLPFASEIVRGLRDSHTIAAQALAANLLDSMVWQHNLGAESLKTITMNLEKKGIRFDLDEYQVKASLTLAPVWRSYEIFWVAKGDQIPSRFARHASAHAVSQTQYSLVNAVTALMLVTSLLRLLDG